MDQNGNWSENLNDITERVKSTDWRKWAMYGCFGAAVYFIISGKRAAGMAAAGVGLAALAAEHPDKFEHVWNNMPDYLERGHKIVNGVQTLIERVSESANNVRAMRGMGRTGTDQYSSRPSY